MDGSTFDRFTRALSEARSRRRLLGVVTSLGLGWLLSGLAADPTDARRKHGRNRGHRPGKNKDNRKGKRTGTGGGDRDEPAPCRTTGERCDQNSECCGGNCFNQQCAATVSTCGGVACNPAGTGCCPEDGCCQPPANQCNGAGLCCAPNCTGRQCGPDGCGKGGVCGTCPTNATCNESTGQCQSTCTPQCQGKQCGPDGCGGNCGSCPPGDTCDEATGQCGNCEECDPNIETCCSGQCVSLLSNNNNCGACGHQCILPTVCGDGVCCMLHNGAQCSATQPCCGFLTCQNGACCTKSGSPCNQDPATCCSGQCNQYGVCA